MQIVFLCTTNFIETEIFNSKGAKDLLLECQEYRFGNNTVAIDAGGFTSQPELLLKLREIWFYGPAGVDFSTYYLSGNTVRFSHRRSFEFFQINLKESATNTSCKSLKRTYMLEK